MNSTIKDIFSTEMVKSIYQGLFDECVDRKVWGDDFDKRLEEANDTFYREMMKLSADENSSAMKAAVDYEVAMSNIYARAGIVVGMLIMQEVNSGKVKLDWLSGD